MGAAPALPLPSPGSSKPIAASALLALVANCIEAERAASSSRAACPDAPTTRDQTGWRAYTVKLRQGEEGVGGHRGALGSDGPDLSGCHELLLPMPQQQAVTADGETVSASLTMVQLPIFNSSEPWRGQAGSHFLDGHALRLRQQEENEHRHYDYEAGKEQESTPLLQRGRGSSTCRSISQ